MDQDKLSIRELLEIANTARIFHRMGTRHERVVTVDYLAARDPLIIPRESPNEAAIETMAPEMTPITYRLEDAMFGGELYVTLVVGSRVLLHPFPWVSYEALAKNTINIPVR